MKTPRNYLLPIVALILFAIVTSGAGCPFTAADVPDEFADSEAKEAAIKKMNSPVTQDGTAPPPVPPADLFKTESFFFESPLDGATMTNPVEFMIDGWEGPPNSHPSLSLDGVVSNWCFRPESYDGDLWNQEFDLAPGLVNVGFRVHNGEHQEIPDVIPEVIPDFSEIPPRRSIEITVE